MGEPTSEGRKSALKGRLVEGVRLIFIALFATGGFQLGSALSKPSGPRTLLYVFLGAGIGYVIGGVLGRLTLRAVTGLEHELRRTPAPQLAGAVVGMVVGLIIGALLMIPLLFLPAPLFQSCFHLCLLDHGKFSGLLLQGRLRLGDLLQSALPPRQLCLHSL